MTSVHARPKALHEWRQMLTRQHGQANLQDHRESHDIRRVRTTLHLLHRLMRISCAHLLELNRLQDGLPCSPGP